MAKAIDRLLEPVRAKFTRPDLIALTNNAYPEDIPAPKGAPKKVCVCRVICLYCIYICIIFVVINMLLYLVFKPAYKTFTYLGWSCWWGRRGSPLRSLCV